MVKFKKNIPRLNSLSEEQVIAFLGEKVSECNFIIKDYYIFENKSKDKLNSYYVGRNQYIKCSKYAKRKGVKFIGILHTHMSFHKSFPSEKDIKTARKGVLNCVMYNNKITFYDRDGIVNVMKIKINIFDYIIFNILRILRA